MNALCEHFEFVASWAALEFGLAPDIRQALDCALKTEEESRELSGDVRCALVQTSAEAPSLAALHEVADVITAALGVAYYLGYTAEGVEHALRSVRRKLSDRQARGESQKLRDRERGIG